MKNGIWKNLVLPAAVLLILLFAHGQAYSQSTPDINSFKPNSGGPGAIITIYGSNLGETIGKSKVMFGTVSADVISWSVNKISVEVPSNANPEDLAETGKGKRTKMMIPVYITLEEGGKTNEKYFDILPSIKGLSPGNGGPGDKVIITGHNFGNYIDRGKVFIGSKEVKVLKWTDGSIDVEMPASINTGDIKEEKKKKDVRKYIEIFVQAGKLKSEGREFRWEPEISSVSPTEAGPGSTIQIEGRNFGKISSSIKVCFGGKEVQPISLADNKMTAAIPETISQEDVKDGALEVKVVIGGVESNSKGISIGPELHRVFPESSNGGVIILKGKKFGKMGETGKVVFASKPEDFAKTLTVKVLSWTDDEVKIEIPVDLNKSTDDCLLSVVVLSGKFTSNEKEYKYKKLEKKEEKKKAKKQKSDQKEEPKEETDGSEK